MSLPPLTLWNSDFLAGIAGAWAKRRKAIGHQARIVGAERFEPSHDDSDERFVLIAAIEQTLSACYGMTAERIGALDAIWRPVLAKGPRKTG